MADINNDIDSTKENLNSDDLLALARKQYSAATSYWNPMWEKGRDDINFLNGTNHWPEEIKQQRDMDNRPSLVINHSPKYLRQVVGDQRQNRPQAKIRPVDSKADPDIAKFYEGLVRNIEYISNFKTVQDTAFRQSAGNAFGYIRIVTEFADDDAFEQDIKYKRVFNPFSIVLDPSANEMDSSDGKFGFATDWIPKDEFKHKYPKAETVDFADAERSGFSDWYRQDEILIAEYFRRVPVKRTLGLLSNGDTINLEGVDVLKLEPMEDGTPVTVLKEKTVDSYKTLRYLISGHDVLEEGKEFPSKYIPLIPVWGEEVITDDGRRDFNSIIRFMKDPNRMYNYMRSAETEHIALMPKAPFIGTAEQFQGYEEEWEEANAKNKPYLKYNADPKASGAPQRQQPPQASSGIINAAMQSKEDMKDTTGLFDASVGAKGNETSGRAILARQREGDVSTYVWIDNLTTAITHATRVVIDMIPRVYDTERTIRVRNLDESEEFIKINQEQIGDDGEVIKINDLSMGKYDVVVETGPSYSTQRVESATAMIEFAQAMGPQAASMVADLVAKNQDWPGADEIGRRLKKLLPPGIAEPEEGEVPPEEPGPTPEDELKAGELEIKQKELGLKEQEIALEYEKLKVEAMRIQSEQGLNEDQVKEVVIQMLQQVNERE